MNKHGYFRGKRVGMILAAVGAAMVVSLILPLRFWWLLVGLCFLFGGICLLRR